MRVRRELVILTGAVLAAAALAAGATPAGAAGPCGGGYLPAGSYAVPETGTRVGTLEVYYSPGTGRKCALAVGYGDTYGAEGTKAVYIDYSHHTYGPWKEHDYGGYAYYAGPVHISAPGRCVDVQAIVHRGSTVAGRYLNNVHCD